MQSFEIKLCTLNAKGRIEWKYLGICSTEKEGIMDLVLVL
jgi:hypothetical protein